MSIYRVDIINGLIVRLSPADAQEGVSVGNVCRASDWHERERGLRRPLFRLQVEGLDMPVVTIVGPGVVGAENRGIFDDIQGQWIDGTFACHIYIMRNTMQYSYALCPPAMTILLFPRLSVTRPHIIECLALIMSGSLLHPLLRSKMNAIRRTKYSLISS